MLDVLDAGRMTSRRAVAALLERHPQVESRYAAVSAEPEQPLVGEPDVRTVLEDSASFLELHVAIASVAEAISWLGLGTVADLTANADRVWRLGTELAGADPAEVLARNRWFADAALRLQGNAPPMSEILDALPGALSDLARISAGVVASCPIDGLERLSARVRSELLGHRCRRAYERLRAFVQRNDPARDERLHLVGRAYAEGRLSMDEASQLTGQPIGELVFAFDRLGFTRPLDALRLKPELRGELLARIGLDRRHRDGRPEPDPRRVRADALSSQRIEGVDARPWLPRIPD